MPQNQVNYSRLTSISAGAFISFMSAWAGYHIGGIPSYFASWVGLGSFVDVGFTTAGLIGGAGLYLYSSKVLNRWPMEKKEDTRNAIQRFLSKEEKESLYEEFKEAIVNIEKELNHSLKPELRQQMFQDLLSSGNLTYNYLRVITKEMMATKETEPKPSQKKYWLF